MESRGRGTIMVRMNQTRVQYMDIWKCHNEPPYVITIF
jgi:hypothetical protein